MLDNEASCGFLALRVEYLVIFTSWLKRVSYAVSERGSTCTSIIRDIDEQQTVRLRRHLPPHRDRVAWPTSLGQAHTTTNYHRTIRAAHLNVPSDAPSPRRPCAMETLLSLSFDNISSKNINKVRKGLRQIEGLLAQICLSDSHLQSPSKRRTSVLHSSGSPSAAAPKSLDALSEDLAFREFFRLQESFEWNGEGCGFTQGGRLNT